MCTLSFVFSNGKAIITHNRDEKTARLPAIAPRKYTVNNTTVFFPKDQEAGGTWFAVAENGTVAVLLNGADQKHIQKPNYRKSRGIIVLDIISSNSPIDFWTIINLENIEPFTLIVFQNNKLYQLRWNEVEKSTINLDVNLKHIWSSSTLYPKDIREKRAQWFDDFVTNKEIITATDLYNFHQNTEIDNTENGLVINRNDKLKTLSITQVVIEKNEVSMFYFDLIEDKKDVTNFQIQVN